MTKASYPVDKQVGSRMRMRRIKPIGLGSRAGWEFERASLGSDYHAWQDCVADRTMKLRHQH